MKRTSITLAAMMAALIFGIASIGSTSPANAAPGNGAFVINNEQCFDMGGGYQQCVDQHAVYNDTATKSGNQSSTGNGKLEWTVLDPAGNVVVSGEDSFHYHSLLKDGVWHESGNHWSATWESGGMTCTSSGDFHFANGEIQYDNFEWACSP